MPGLRYLSILNLLFMLVLAPQSQAGQIIHLNSTQQFIGTPLSIDQAESLIDRMASVLSPGKSMDGKSVHAEPYCINGCRPLNPVYGTCRSPKKKYYENQIDDALSKGNETINLLMNTVSENPEKEICFREAMSNHGGPFMNCPTDARSYFSSETSLNNRMRVEKSCNSRDKTHLAQISFELATSCFADYLVGEQASAIQKSSISNALFALISWESGFHSNAVSHKGAGGIGQLTYGALKDIETNKIIEGMQAHVNKNKDSNQACAQLSRVPLRKIPSETGSCQRINVDNGNPLTNLIHTIGYQKIIRKNYLERRIGAIPRLQTILKNMDDGKREKLLSSLSVWANNTGPSGLTNPFLNFATTHRGQALLQENNSDQFLKELEAFVRNHPSNINRADETGNFFKNLQNRVDIIKKAANDVGGSRCAY